jgi:hypothetical protein
LGVWSTDNLNAALTNWGPTNTNLANVRVDHLQRRSSDCLIAAATHGRGLYTAIVGPCTVLPAPIAPPPVTPVVKGDGSVNGTVTLVPVPGQPVFNLNISDGDIYNAEVYDAAGKLLRQTKMSGSYRFDMAEHGTGIYLIKVTNERTNVVTTRKVVL